jgi:hypothetical protein
VEEAGRRRADLLNQAQSDALVHQAWTEWVVTDPYLLSSLSPWSGPGLVYGLLARAGQLYPTSPYVPIAQHIVAVQSGVPVPPIPPAPPAPHVPPAPPSGVVQPIPVAPSPASPVAGGPTASAPSVSNRSRQRLQTTFSHMSGVPTSPSSSPRSSGVPQTGKLDSPRQLRQFLVQPGIAPPPPVARPPVAQPRMTPSMPPVVRQPPVSGHYGRPAVPPAPSVHAPHVPSGAIQPPPSSSGRGLSQLQRSFLGAAPRGGSSSGGGKSGGALGGR